MNKSNWTYTKMSVPLTERLNTWLLFKNRLQPKSAGILVKEVVHSTGHPQGRRRVGLFPKGLPWWPRRAREHLCLGIGPILRR